MNCVPSITTIMLKVCLSDDYFVGVVGDEDEFPLLLLAGTQVLLYNTFVIVVEMSPAVLSTAMFAALYSPLL